MTHIWKNIMLMACVFLPGVLWSQNLLQGKITDAQTGEPLPSTNITIEGTNNGTVSNLQGEYALSLHSDTATLSFRYIGYKDTTLTVTFGEAPRKTLDIKLSGDVSVTNEVVVTGALQGQAKALNQQKNADNIKNVVSADQIGRFPDQNSAEALQRVSGVNIERDQGEGRYVLIRGLAPQFTNINVNGEQIPSPEADVRFVALDAIPAGQLASMEVSKTLTPDMDADAIGGSVNLITRTAKDSTWDVSGSLAGGYNNLMGKTNVNGNIRIGRRFGKDQKFGVLVNTSYYQNQLGSDNWEREPFDNELELRDYELVRTRLGLSSTLDYKLDNSNEFYFRTLYSDFTDREWRRRYVFVPDDEEIEKLTKDRFESQSILSLNLGGKHTFPKVQIDYEVQYALGEQNTPYDNEAVFIAGIPSTLNFDGKNYPSFNAAGYLDNSQYEFDELETGNTLAQDRNITAKFNIGVPYSIKSQSGLLKFGAKMRRKEKSFDVSVDKYGNLGGVPTLDNFEGGLLDDNFLGGQYTLSTPLSLPSLFDYYNRNPQQFELEIEDKAVDEALETYEATENVTAAYLMTRQSINKFLIIAGARYEQTTVNYKSSDVIFGNNGDLSEIRSVEGSTHYSLFLPQVNVKYTLGKFTNLRGALTYSYARPNFADIVPAQEINLLDRQARVGNPELAPVKATNFDLLAEHYFGNVGILSGGFFHKRLNGFIYPQVIRNTTYPLQGSPLATEIDVTQSQNGEDATLSGFEFNFQRKLDFLPGKLSALTVYTNYSYTSSEAQIQSRTEETGLESIDLPGQAAHVGNASLAYQGSKLNARISLNFNGEYLSEVGGAPEEDIFIANRAQLDVSASYAITPKFRIFTEILNLTNQPFEAYAGSKDVYIQQEYYSWWSRLGLSFDL